MHIADKSQSKILFYFLLYSFGYIFAHLILTSIFSFFHFLLSHDLGTINNWLSLNGWEVLGFAKILSAIVTIKIVSFNKYNVTPLWDGFKQLKSWPSRKIIIVSFFILSVFYALIHQFGGGVQDSIYMDNLAMSSILGSILFFGVDILILGFLMNFFQSQLPQRFELAFHLMILTLIVTVLDFVLLYLAKLNISVIDQFMPWIKLSTYTTSFFLFFMVLKILKSEIYLSELIHSVLFLSIFVLCSKVVLPYLDKYILFLVVHFIFLYFLLLQRNMMDILVYLVIIVSILSSFFGIDLVWDNNYSMFAYNKNIPALGVIGIWIIALTYYRKSKF